MPIMVRQQMKFVIGRCAGSPEWPNAAKLSPFGSILLRSGYLIKCFVAGGNFSAAFCGVGKAEKERLRFQAFLSLKCDYIYVIH